MCRELRLFAQGRPRGVTAVRLQVLKAIEESRVAVSYLLPPGAGCSCRLQRGVRGHYALAAPYYCHFTSPIRRYPDLVVHRQLSQLLETGRPVAPRDFEAVNEALASIATHSSDRERRAEAAERESLLWKKIVFMTDSSRARSSTPSSPA